MQLLRHYLLRSSDLKLGGKPDYIWSRLLAVSYITYGDAILHIYIFVNLEA